jgi:cell division septation protein DedD
MGPQLFNIIKASLMDPDMEELPTDTNRGLDFRVVKTSKGGYADYSTSNWARKETALTEAEQAAVNANGLYNLNDFLPKKPSETELAIIKQMFEDSVDGKAYDPEKYASYYRPAGVAAPNSTQAPTPTPTLVATSSPATKVEDNNVPFETAETPAAAQPVKTESSGTGQKAEDILAMIRSRQNQ